MTDLYSPSDTKHATSQEFDDGDAPTGSSINPLGEAAFDTATWCVNRIGVARLINAWSVEVARGTALGVQSASAYGSGTPYTVASFAVEANDVIEVAGLVHGKATAVACEAHYALGGRIGSGAISWQTPEVEYEQISTKNAPMPLNATFVASDAGTFHLLLWMISDDNTHEIQINSPLRVRVTQMRANT